jgi:hypothetical protein
MMYCRSCGKPLHESAQFCPQCGYSFAAPTLPATPAAPSGSLWMAITALTLSILALLILLSTAGDMDTLSKLSELESAFGGHSLKRKLAENAADSALGGLVLALPGGIFGVISLAQKRGGRGMAIAAVVISAINLLLILGLFGLSQ